MRYGRGNAPDSPRPAAVAGYWFPRSPVRQSGNSAAGTIQALSDDAFFLQAGRSTAGLTLLGEMRQSGEWHFLLPMTYEKIRYSVEDPGVATIALDDPDTRNSLSNQLLGELIEAFEAAREDEAVRCVVLASTHEKIFSSGGNVAQFAADTPLVHRHLATERFVRLFRLIGTLGKPSVCAVNGHALAGALGLALACDLIVAKDSAEFGTPEINLGLFPFMIMALIYRNVPRKKANEMLLLGERMSAAEAKEAGIVNRVVPADEFEAAVADWAAKLAGKSPVVMRLGQGAVVRQAGIG